MARDRDSGDSNARAAKAPRAGKAEKADKPKGAERRIRGAPARLIGRTPWLRRRYARMVLRTIRRRRKKNKPLPDGLVLVERRLRGLPPAKQEELVERLLEESAAPTAAANRAMRRAADRPERRSGQGGGRRPGSLGGQPRPRPR